MCGILQKVILHVLIKNPKITTTQLIPKVAEIVWGEPISLTTQKNPELPIFKEKARLSQLTAIKKSLISLKKLGFIKEEERCGYKKEVSITEGGLIYYCLKDPSRSKRKEGLQDVSVIWKCEDFLLTEVGKFLCDIGIQLYYSKINFPALQAILDALNGHGNFEKIPIHQVRENPLVQTLFKHQPKKFPEIFFVTFVRPDRQQKLFREAAAPVHFKKIFIEHPGKILAFGSAKNNAEFKECCEAIKKIYYGLDEGIVKLYSLLQILIDDWESFFYDLHNK